MTMVERYAHMTHERVAKVSGDINGIWQTPARLEEARDSDISWNPARMLERETRLELATPTLARLCSTTELFPH